MNSRSKGKAGELELAHVLQEYGYEARRGHYPEPDVLGIPGVHIECKRREQLRILEWMEQSKKDAKPGEIPVVMHRVNRGEWLVTMRLTDWMVMKA